MLRKSYVACQRKRKHKLIQTNKRSSNFHLFFRIQNPMVFPSKQYMNFKAIRKHSRTKIRTRKRPIRHNRLLSSLPPNFQLPDRPDQRLPNFPPQPLHTPIRTLFAFPFRDRIILVARNQALWECFWQDLKRGHAGSAN